MDENDVKIDILFKQIKDMAMINCVCSVMPEKEARMTKRFLGAFLKHDVPPETVLAIISEIAEEGWLNDE